MSGQDYENLIHTTSDLTLQQKFEQAPLTELWCSLLQEYSEMYKSAVLKLLPFPTTYLCEVGFVRYAATKTKYHNRLDVAPDTRIQLSSTTPSSLRLCDKKTVPLFTLMTQGKVKDTVSL
jgi:hypothetical protein